MDRASTEKDLPHLFDRFLTQMEGHADTQRGVGLGLSISKTIIAAHGGEIVAFNASPHGAVFRFTLPLSESKEVKSD